MFVENFSNCAPLTRGSSHVLASSSCTMRKFLAELGDASSLPHESNVFFIQVFDEGTVIIIIIIQRVGVEKAILLVQLGV